MTSYHVAPATWSCEGSISTPEGRLISTRGAGFEGLGYLRISVQGRLQGYAEASKDGRTNPEYGE